MRRKTIWLLPALAAFAAAPASPLPTTAPHATAVAAAHPEPALPAEVLPDHGADDIYALEAALDDSVRVVSVSAVDWCSGRRLDLAALGEMCGARGILLVVDMAQALGVVPLDPQAMGIGAMAGSAWKWLLGPLGVGIFYCAPALLDRLSLAFVGTTTVVDAQAYLDYDFTAKPDAARFEFSTPNINDWVYLLASLTLLEEIGFENVRRRIFQINEYLRPGLRRKGYRILGADQERERSGILTFAREGMDAANIVRALAAQGIVTAERGGGVRVSPHIYINEADMDRLLEAL